MGKKRTTAKKLSPKQRAAARYRADGLSLEESSLKAGFSESYSASCRAFESIAMQNEVTRLLDEAVDSSKLDKRHVLRRLMLLGFANVGDFLTYTNSGVTLVPSCDLTRDQLYCVEEVTQRKTRFGTAIKFKLCDRQRALESMGKYLKMFVQKIEVEQVDGDISEFDTEKAINKELDSLINLVESGGE